MMTNSPSVELTEGKLDQVSGAPEQGLDASQDLQRYMEAYHQTMAMITNIISQARHTSNTIVSNMKAEYPAPNGRRIGLPKAVQFDVRLGE
jgi:hypothetical protein